MKRLSIMMIVCLLVLGAPFAALAQENTPNVPPQLVNLAPVAFTSEIIETYGDKVVQVRLQINLSEEGLVQEAVQVVQSSGSDAIDQVVISAVKNSVFRPAYINSKATPSSVLLPLQIRIERATQESSQP